MPNHATLVAVAILLVVVVDIVWHAYSRVRKSGVERLASGAPPSVRETARAASPRRLPSNRRGTPRIATILTVTVLVLLTPATAAPTSASPPQLAAASEAVAPGSTMTVSGWGFPGYQQGQIVIDGALGPVVSYLVRSNGTFDVTLVVPELTPGDHTISANAPNIIAATQFTVLAPDGTSPTETPGASVGPTATSGGTASPTQVPSTAAPPTATPAPTPAPTPLVTPAPTPIPSSVPTSGDHVFVIVMENHAYQQVWNTANGPYITSLGNAGGVASNYFAITHPSLPNYLDIFGGLELRDHGRLQPLERLPRQRAQSWGQPGRRRPIVEGLLRVDALDLRNGKQRRVCRSS